MGAKFEIYTIINELAAQGKGIIMISSELPELIGESDRIVVMCRGRLTGIVDRADATRRPSCASRRTSLMRPRSSPAVSEGMGATDTTFEADERRAAGARAARPVRRREWVSGNAILVTPASSSASRSTTPDFISANSVRNILTNSSTRSSWRSERAVLISRGVDLSGGRMVGLAAVVSASMLQTETYPALFFPTCRRCRSSCPSRSRSRSRPSSAASTASSSPLRAAVHRHARDDGHRLRHDGHLLRPATQQLAADLRIRDDLSYLGTARWGWVVSIPFIVAVAGTAAVIFWVLLEKTVFGKNVYAIGGNPRPRRCRA